MDSMDDARRTGPFLLVLLLLFQTMAMMPAAANPTGGTVNTFSNGQAQVSVSLIAGLLLKVGAATTGSAASSTNQPIFEKYKCVSFAMFAECLGEIPLKCVKSQEILEN